MKNQNWKDKQSKPNKFIQYSGLGFQLLVAILIGLGIGTFIDNKLDTDPIFTAIFSLVFLFAGMYIVIRDVIKMNQ